jgi:hypothetical protein
MKSRDFAFWLRGFLEINEASDYENEGLTIEQTEIIKRHLDLVFEREIEPLDLSLEEKKSDGGSYYPFPPPFITGHNFAPTSYPDNTVYC